MATRSRLAAGRIATIGCSIGCMLGFAAAPSLAQSVNTETVTPDDASKTHPAPTELPRLGFGGTSGFMQDFTASLDTQYDRYLEFKKNVSETYNLDFSLDFSFYPQFGTSGNPVWLASYYPSVTWRPFTNTAIGSGEIEVTIGHQAYFSHTNTGAQAERLGLITFPNDWVSDNFTWSTVAYTHTLPGDMSWLSITGGQYNLFTFDPNTYAGNAQTTFISYSFAQDATQTFPNAGLGAYVKAQVPNSQFLVAGGFQGATDLNGGSLTSRGFDTGKFVGWGNIEWTPTIPGVGAGIYSLLIYDQPFVPDVTGHSTGISLSASQEITDKWGAFARVNNATGSDIPIRTSFAAGGVRNDPFRRNPADQLGLAVGWNKTNRHALGETEARGGEWVNEVYYNFTIFKGMSLTPDAQVFWNPALLPKAGPAAVFTVRTTLFF